MLYKLLGNVVVRDNLASSYALCAVVEMEHFCERGFKSKASTVQSQEE